MKPTPAGFDPRPTPTKMNHPQPIIRPARNRRRQPAFPQLWHYVAAVLASVNIVLWLVYFVISNQAIQ